ncbi:hypothetical protein DIPPA_23326 [Diplonema papillatum]|nr:hypothetical protein DIPPA_23326 [Diplonema papillatum]|eukprot:gene16413-25163_t
MQERGGKRRKLPPVLLPLLAAAALLSAAAWAAGRAAPTGRGPAAAFAAVADIHYAGPAAAGPKGPAALRKLAAALAAAAASGSWDCLAVLGDSKDEDPTLRTRAAGQRNLAQVAAAVRGAWRAPVLWALGNHDVDRGPKADWIAGVGLEYEAFHSRRVGRRVTVVTLDVGFTGEGEPWDCLSCNAENEHRDWNRSFVPAEQLAWLGGQVAQAEAEGRRVVVLSHARLDVPQPGEQRYFVQNAAAVRSALNARTVALVLHGHDHLAVHSPVVLDGIPYYTIPGMVTSSLDAVSWIGVSISGCSVSINGHGPAPSFQYSSPCV